MGLSVPVLSPLPSSPTSLKPQVQSVPSLLSANACRLPAAMAAIFDKCVAQGAVVPEAQTCAGAVCALAVPSPSWPLVLSPHVQTVPSFFSTTAKWRPAAIAATFVNGWVHGSVSFAQTWIGEVLQ